MVITSIIVPIIIGTFILIPIFLFAYFNLLLKYQSYPLKLHSIKISNYIHFNIIIIKYKLYQLVQKYYQLYWFYYSLCKRVNNQLIKNIFNLTLWFHLLANICFTISLSTGSINYGFSFWVYLVTFSQFILISSFLYILIVASNELYKSKNLIFQSIMKCYFCSKTKLHSKHYFRLLIILEIIYPIKVFRFTLGPMGRISPKSLITFFPVYSSLIFKVLPYFYDR